jgi:hypothetical protein
MAGRCPVEFGCNWSGKAEEMFELLKKPWIARIIDYRSSDWPDAQQSVS